MSVSYCRLLVGFLDLSSRSHCQYPLAASPYTEVLYLIHVVPCLWLAVRWLVGLRTGHRLFLPVHTKTWRQSAIKRFTENLFADLLDLFSDQPSWTQLTRVMVPIYLQARHTHHCTLPTQLRTLESSVDLQQSSSLPLPSRLRPPLCTIAAPQMRMPRR